MSTQEILSELPRLSSTEQELIAQALRELRSMAYTGANPRKAGLHSGAWEVEESFDEELPATFWMGVP